ncbi:Z1 domain-containing protein [Leptospira tipperaryensis]|uniref:Z1 domain-containing protein n=1 Tax=Leptospira tipperaryensis TaxID=2564040 RepID=UPI00084C93C2|nr:Z1 domain-containing protein [Leptospira tipperaryensis]
MTNQQIVKVLNNNSPNWRPIIGEETTKLIAHLNLPASKEKIEKEAFSILSKCVPPLAGNTGNSTGLVIGYVQSGKTMSFTTLSALARDNNYQVIILITGISVPLFNQSKNRIQNDLRLVSRSDRKWRYFENPTDNDRNSLRDTLDDWKDSSVPEGNKQTILIVVMKNHRHLEKLNRLFSHIDFSGSSAIIIDDEADQASLNTKVKNNGQSTTYKRMLSLRSHFKNHSFLQYTATPQAPLLINIIDTLSPNFVEVLTPGSEYTGGKEFFIENPHLIEDIPEQDIPNAESEFESAPESLLKAMRYFFIGVAIGEINKNARNRSMMVHPSQKTIKHSDYTTWINIIKNEWKSILELTSESDERTQLIKDFKAVYNDIKINNEDIPSFGEIENILVYSIRKTNVQPLNASKGKTPSVDWSSVYSHILVGGQAMDRGFTVEGLTVTYMPRMLGVGNADTFQQRARFFGYKRSYIGLCKVFLGEAVRQAYEGYVKHEEDIRRQMIELNENKKSLNEWKRLFFLNNALRPTRSNVLHLDYVRLSFNDVWHQIDVPHDSTDSYKANYDIVKKFIEKNNFTEDGSSPLVSEKNLILDNFSLSQLMEELLARFNVAHIEDSQRVTAFLIVLRNILDENPDELCRVYLMSAGKPRERSVDNDDSIKQLYMGANPVSPREERGRIYPGDREVFDPEKTNIQIHILNIKKNDKIIAYNVPTLAFRIPKKYSTELIYQEQVK